MSFLGSASGVGRAGRALLQHRVIAATAGAATAVLVVGVRVRRDVVEWVRPRDACQRQQQQARRDHDPHPPVTTTKAKVAAPVLPLKVVSVSPAGGAHDVNGAAPITVKFSDRAVAADPAADALPVGQGQLAGIG